MSVKVEMVDVQGQLEREIADRRMARKDVAVRDTEQQEQEVLTMRELAEATRECTPCLPEQEVAEAGEGT